jgi:hypothetical protein
MTAEHQCAARVDAGGEHHEAGDGKTDNPHAVKYTSGFQPILVWDDFAELYVSLQKA